jgi:hypothetical protein
MRSTRSFSLVIRRIPVTDWLKDFLQRSPGPKVVDIGSLLRDPLPRDEAAPDSEPEKLARIDHHAIIAAAMRARPEDVTDGRWRTALHGLRTFLDSGFSDQALALGWTHPELFAVPPVWAAIDRCGLALLVADRQVIEVTAETIVIRTESGAVQRFYRKPKPDWAVAYKARLKSAGLDAGNEEVQLRAFEATVKLCMSSTGSISKRRRRW